MRIPDISLLLGLILKLTKFPKDKEDEQEEKEEEEEKEESVQKKPDRKISYYSNISKPSGKNVGEFFPSILRICNIKKSVKHI